MFQYNWQKRIVAATPLIALIIFLSVGFLYDAWHPGWTAFLLIPIVPFLVGLKQIRITFPLIVFVAYIALGISGYWHPGWIIFLLIPLQNILFPPQTISKYIKKEDKNKSKPKDYMDAEIDE
ncbi:hypothetical protein [Acholeplasma granularum]|uniref:hypothetical protein n=1 Tax=Acholeplasma granularum TaxID=264635 RepID=UPI00046EEDAA|nr:hypothetical protein [Acholeplasma granularum]